MLQNKDSFFPRCVLQAILHCSISLQEIMAIILGRVLKENNVLRFVPFMGLTDIIASPPTH